MRKFFGLAVVLAIFTTQLPARASGTGAAKTIEVESVTKEISRGKQSGIKVQIYQATKKDVAKDWAKLIHQNTKSKVEEIGNEISIIGTHIPEISAEPLNIYAVINDYIDYIEVNAFFETSQGFITPEKAETEFLSCRKFLRDFGVAQYKEAVKQEKKQEEKNLDKLNNDLKSIVRTNDKLHKDIAKEEQDILTAKSDIASNEMEQERLRQEIHSAKGNLYNIRGEEARKIAEKEIKELEKTLESVRKKNDNLHKEIVDSEANIRSYHRSIDDNTILVNRKEEEIDQQSEVIYQVEQKLLAIR